MNVRAYQPTASLASICPRRDHSASLNVTYGQKVESPAVFAFLHKKKNHYKSVPIQIPRDSGLAQSVLWGSNPAVTLLLHHSGKLADVRLQLSPNLLVPKVHVLIFPQVELSLSSHSIFKSFPVQCLRISFIIYVWVECIPNHYSF